MIGWHSQPARIRRGFTLLELLAVIAIIAIITVAVVPAVTGPLRSSNLTNGSLALMDTLNLARQTALTNNSPVEVRIYKTGGATSPTDLQYRAYRLFSVDANNNKQALGTLKHLTEPVIISSGTTLSSLMAGRSGNSVQPEDYPVPDNTAYIWFRFRPNGGTDLTPVEGTGSNWFLTLLLENAPTTGTAGLPANYFTIQIDPVTGRARSFRP